MLKKDNEREKVGDCIIKESKKLNTIFMSLSDACNPEVQSVRERRPVFSITIIITIILSV